MTFSWTWWTSYRCFLGSNDYALSEKRNLTFHIANIFHEVNRRSSSLFAPTSVELVLIWISAARSMMGRPCYPPLRTTYACNENNNRRVQSTGTERNSTEPVVTYPCFSLSSSSLSCFRRCSLSHLENQENCPGKRAMRNRRKPLLAREKITGGYFLHSVNKR